MVTRIPATSDAIRLPNGQVFYSTDPRQLGAARFIVNEIFYKKIYERAGFHLGRGDTVVDIGANMGLFAMWASAQLDRGRVLSIEPTSGCFQTIEENISRNSLRNVTPLKVALGAEEGALELVEYPGFNAVTHAAHIKPASWGQFFIRLLYGKYAAPPQKSSVPCRTLEHVLDENKIDSVDLLKVDCEGSEYEILRATPDSVLRRVRRVVMEFHELRADHCRSILVDRLRSAGFEVTVHKPWFSHWFLKTGMIWASRN